MLRHQSAGQIFFLLPEGHFEALGNSSSLTGFDLRPLQNIENLGRAHSPRLNGGCNSSMTPARACAAAGLLLTQLQIWP